MLSDNTKRIEWIDVAKALAIILVGIGHYNCPRGLQIWIYSFHMPLFFILSGVTLDIKKYKFVKFVKRKAKAFLVPWLMAVCVNVVFQSACRSIGISAVDDHIYMIPFKIIVNGD